MTEKIKAMEIHPMRGHSRGEWYCSLDDIAENEEEAEYWAVFGVTHRGNKHCLGEFATRSAANSAAHGMRTLGTPTEASPPSRKIVQIEVVSDANDSAMVDLFALCADGTVWRRGIGTGRASGLLDDRWERIPLDSMEDSAVEAAMARIFAYKN